MAQITNTYSTPDGNVSQTYDTAKPQATFNPSLESLGLKDIQANLEVKSQQSKFEEEAKKASGRYIIVKETNLMKEGLKKFNSWLGGFYGTNDVVKKLKVGDVIDIVKSGSGGSGIVATPYLFLADGSYIVAYDAKREGNTGYELPRQSTPEEELQKAMLQVNNLKSQNQESFLQRHKTHLIILGGIVLAYFAYKKYKK